METIKQKIGFLKGADEEMTMETFAQAMIPFIRKG